MVETNMNLRETHIVGKRTQEWILNGDQCAALKLRHIPYAGISDAAKPYTMIRHRPSHLHFLICLGGRGEVWIDERWQTCQTGHLYISPPATFTAFRAIAGSRWQFGWIFFAQTAAQRLSSITRCELRKTDPLPFECALRGLLREWQDYFENAAANAWSSLLHTACLRSLQPAPARCRLHEIWREVEGSPSDDWNAGRLAHRAGISEEHLRRITLQETGHSPMRHVTHLRMHKAMLLLQTTSLTIEAIAEAVGYKNAFAFSTAFKRQMHCSPSSCRQPS